MRVLLHLITSTKCDKLCFLFDCNAIICEGPQPHSHLMSYHVSSSLSVSNKLYTMISKISLLCYFNLEHKIIDETIKMKLVLYHWQYHVIASTSYGVRIELLAPPQKHTSLLSSN